MATKRTRAADAPNPLHLAGRLQDLIARLGVEAMTFTAKPKVEDTAISGSRGQTSIPMTPAPPILSRTP